MRLSTLFVMTAGLLGCANYGQPGGDDSWLDDVVPSSPAEIRVPPPANSPPKRAEERTNVAEQPALKSVAEKAASSPPSRDPGPRREIAPRWTGAAVYVLGDGSCRPCERLVADLHARRFAGWKTGAGDDVHFKVIDWQQRAPGTDPAIEMLPTVVYFVEGKAVSRVTGYGGSPTELDAILNKHPRVKKATVRDQTGAVFAPRCDPARCRRASCNCRPGADCGCLSATGLVEQGQPSVTIRPPVTVVDYVTEPLFVVAAPPPRLLAPPPACGTSFHFGVNVGSGGP